MTDYAPLVERAFTLPPCERSYDIEQIDGRVPSFLSGTCYLNGPARFSRGPVQYRNWLDGDGMVTALRFDRGRARVTHRFVRSTKFVDEEAAARPLYRAFGTAFEGDRLKRGIGLESPVNVSAYAFGDALLAFGEQGLPWALDPDTLETRGLHTFGGQLNEITPFSAHPKFDHTTGEMFNFGVSFSATNPALNLFRFDRQGTLVYRRRFALPYPSSIHDFAISHSYAVVYVSPFVLSMDALMREGRTLMDALSWEPSRGSQLMIASRDTGELVASIPIGSRYCLHLVNAFERDDRLVVDLVEYERPVYGEYQVIPNLFTDVGDARPVRLSVDVRARAVTDRREVDYRFAPDFPSIDATLTAQPYRRFWMLGIGHAGKPGRKFFDQLVRVDWESQGPLDVYQAPPQTYLGGEPLYIGDPRDPAAAGAVVCQIFDAGRAASAFAVFDAFDMARGPLAVLHQTSPIPPLFHASFRAH